MASSTPIDVQVKRYSTLRIVANMRDAVGAVIVLTDALYPQGWLADQPGGTISDAVVTVSGALTGEVTVLFSDTIIGALKPGRYPWECWLQLPSSGDRITVGGTITIEAALKQPVWS